MNRYVIDETHEVREFDEVGSEIPEIFEPAGKVRLLSLVVGKAQIVIILNEPVTLTRESPPGVSGPIVYGSGGTFHFLHRLSNTLLSDVYEGTYEIRLSVNLELTSPRRSPSTIEEMRKELQDFASMLARRPWVSR